MLNRLFLCIFLSFCFCQKTIHDFGDKKIVDYDFYFENQKNSWDQLSLENKQKGFDSFLKKELVLYDFEKNKLDFAPSFFLKIKEREKQLAVNLYYELFVAGKNIDPHYLSLIKKNINKELFVHHVLFGYKGCALPLDFIKTKEQAFEEALSFSSDLKKGFSLKNNLEKVSFFQEKALSFSQDPNVKQNQGSLGWIYWGRSVDSFQIPVFSTPLNQVSNPILTEYGYHVVLVEKERLSNFSYYDPLVLDGQLVRFGLQSLSVDSLRHFSSSHDQNLLLDGGFYLNESYVKSLVDGFVLYLQEEGLRFNKRVLLDFLSSHANKNVLFVFKNKGFGLGWFLDKIKKTPSTRVSSFDSLQEFKSLLSKYVIQEEAFLLSKKANVLSSPYFKQELKKHKKNLVFNEYIKYKNSLLPHIDSSLVQKKYQKGLKDSVFYFPKKALVKEIKSSSEAFIDSALNHYLLNKDFDSTFLLFGDKKDSDVLKSLTKGTKGVLGEVVFSLKKNEVSNKIKNIDKTFSLIKVFDFVKPQAKSLSLVYPQIEKKLKKHKEDSLKTNLLKDLKTLFGVSFDFLEL